MNSENQDSNSQEITSPIAFDCEHYGCGNDEPRINKEINVEMQSPMLRADTIICKRAVTEGVIIEEETLTAENEEDMHKSEVKQKMSQTKTN